MQLALSIAIMLVPTSVAVMQVLKSYCDYVGGNFCFTYLVDLLVAIMQAPFLLQFTDTSI